MHQVVLQVILVQTKYELLSQFKKYARRLQTYLKNRSPAEIMKTFILKTVLTHTLPEFEGVFGG